MTGRSRVLLGLLPPAVVSVALVWFVASGRWGLVGIWVVPSVIDWPTGFGDLANVTDTADCVRSGGPLEGCDPYGRPFQPYVVLPARILAFLGLGLAQTGVLGVLLAVLWVVVIGTSSTWIALRWSRGAGELTLSLLTVVVAGVAPPTLLGIERGTLDIVVVALAMGGLLVIAAVDQRTAPYGRWLGEAIGSIALALAVVVKFFAIGVFAAFVAPRRWRVLPLVAGGVTTLWLLLNMDDVLLASRTAGSNVPSTTRIMFSSTTLFVTALTEDPGAFFPAEGQMLPMALLRVLGVLLVLAFAVIWWLWLRRSPSMPTSSWLLVAGGGFMLLVPYVLGESNDYRLIVLLLPMAGLLRWRASSSRAASEWRRGAAVWTAVGCTLLALVTGSAMLPNEYGFLMPEPVLLVGDLALAAALGMCLAVWVRAWRLSVARG